MSFSSTTQQEGMIAVASTASYLQCNINQKQTQLVQGLQIRNCFLPDNQNSEQHKICQEKAGVREAPSRTQLLRDRGNIRSEEMQQFSSFSNNQFSQACCEGSNRLRRIKALFSPSGNLSVYQTGSGLISSQHTNTHTQAHTCTHISQYRYLESLFFVTVHRAEPCSLLYYLCSKNGTTSHF